MHRYLEKNWDYMPQTGGPGPRYDTGEESRNPTRSTPVPSDNLGFGRSDAEWSENHSVTQSFELLARHSL